MKTNKRYSLKMVKQETREIELTKDVSRYNLKNMSAKERIYKLLNN